MGSFGLLVIAPQHLTTHYPDMLLAQNCPLSTDATIHGWTAHVLLYQSQMRNLVQKKKIVQGVPLNHTG